MTYISCFWMETWGRDSVRECLTSIQIDYSRIYRGGWSTFFNSSMFVGSAAVAGFLSVWKKIHKRRIILFCIAWFLLLITPILTTLLTGMVQPIRSHFAFPLIAAFVVFFSYEAVRSAAESKVILRRLACGVVLAIGITAGWKQSVTVGQLWETAHETYQADRLLAQRIYDRVCMVTDAQDMTKCQVIFVGAKNAEISSNAVTGDVIGHSRFQWDAQSAYAMNGRIYAYLDALGLVLDCSKAGDELGILCQEAEEAAKDHLAWPMSDSVFRWRDGLVVVKLSETAVGEEGH